VNNISMIGVGYVGLVTGACLADLGNQVTCLDCDADKIAQIQKGIMPIFEPGLEELVARNVQAGRLTFTTSYDEAIPQAEIVFIAVGTPSGFTGQADLHFVEEAAQSIAMAMTKPIIVVNKSTVPIGTGDLVADIINKHKVNDVEVAVVSNPEFLREGSGV
jgi:UDPglucose 6-dehydrogenase